VGRAGSLFSIFFADGVVIDYATAQRTNVPRYAAFFHSMLDAGIYLPPSAYEAWFTSSAHDDVALQLIADALPAAAKAAAAVPERVAADSSAADRA
ncbi:MAG: glutamate-semialdehyde -aminomutase, partial [Mycobacterium sp.]|nr:glutamate-semialdehyde -aminomutase [Mycobacterium sp.]